MKKFSICAFALAAALGREASAGVVLTNIGIAAAVRGVIKAQAPDASVGREIASGKPVYLNDHITTGAGARMQILLLDQTTFTIGPNSDMVLDEFVYDPATNAGKVTASITKGAFRFVTGKVAQRNPSDMKVKLPVGTIGIRGTIVEGQVDAQNADILLSGPGPDNNAHERAGGISVSNDAGNVEINSAGYGTSIRNGGAPAEGYRFTADQVGGIHGQLSGGGSASNGGGAPAGQTASNGAASEASSEGSAESSADASSSASSEDSSAAGVEGSASQESGEAEASGGINFDTTATDLVAQNDDTSSFAAQDAEANAAVAEDSTWDDILAIPSGTGEYVGSGSYSGVSGTADISGTFNVDLIVDFGARTLGGSGSNLSISGDVSDSQSINAVDYAAHAAQFPSGTSASYTFKSGDLGLSSSESGTFAGTKVQFKNVDGQAAGGAVVDMTYTKSFSGVSASGQTDVLPRQEVSPR